MPVAECHNTGRLLINELRLGEDDMLLEVSGISTVLKVVCYKKVERSLG